MDRNRLKKMLELAGDDELASLVSEIDQGLDRVHRIKEQTGRNDPALKPVLDKNRWKKLLERVEKAENSFREKLDRATDGVAVVLNGGGGKGCYQVGAYQVLEEYFAREKTEGDRPARKVTAFAGTSVGALNGALFCAGDSHKAEAMWSSMVPDKLFHTADSIGAGFQNSAYLEELIRGSGMIKPGLQGEDQAEQQGEDQAEANRPLLLVTAFNQTRGYPEDFIMDQLGSEEKISCLLASAAYPFVFDSKTINKADYLDGGLPIFGDNSPFAPLYHLGFRRFIVIHTQSAREAKDNVWMQLLNMKINQEKYYGGSVFIHIYPSMDMGDLFEGTLNFSPGYIRRGIALGRQDMENHLEELGFLDLEPDEFSEVHIRDGRKYFSLENLLENL